MSSTTIGSGRASTASGLDSVLDRANSAQAVVQRFLARAGQPDPARLARPRLRRLRSTEVHPRRQPGRGPGQPHLESLTFGVIDGYAALAITATLEVFVGLTFITGVLLRIGLLALAGTFVGIFSPLVFFTGELFTGAGPTLTAQYILKDVVLVAAAMVVGAVALKRPIGRR